MRAAERLAAVACLLEEGECTGIVLRDTLGVAIENPEASTPVHGAAFASLLQQRECARGIPLDASSALVRDAKARAPFADAAAAGALEERCGMRVIPKDVFAALQPSGEVVARGVVTCGTGCTQSLGLLISGMAGEEYDAGYDEEWEKAGAPSVERGDSWSHACESAGRR
jgi:hypothetical protein